MSKRLEGIHHVTAITGDAPRNLDFYTRALGLRLVKKTVNQDDPTVYHLFYADDRGSPGSDITFFEYPGLGRGRAGAGMVHTVTWRVASEDALDFWAERLAGEGIETARDTGTLRLHDPEGLGLELAVIAAQDEPLSAWHPEIPPELALQGFEGVRAYASDPTRSADFLGETLGFAGDDGAWEARGKQRGSRYTYDAAPEARGLSGAGTVHHVAWSSPLN
jgi:glyoxalase family protein